MKLKTSFILAFVIICVAIVFTYYKNTISNVYSADGDGVINLDDSERTFTVELDFHPGSTGYLWYLKNHDERLLRPTGNEVIVPEQLEGKGKLIGMAAKHAFTFKVLASRKVPQITELTFVKIQPTVLSKDEPVIEKTFRVTI